MLSLVKEAKRVGLPAASIRDAGRTQVASGTRTVAAIGPGKGKVSLSHLSFLRSYQNGRFSNRSSQVVLIDFTQLLLIVQAAKAVKFDN